MLIVRKETPREVHHLVLALPGVIKNVEVSDDGNVCVRHLANNKLNVLVRNEHAKRLNVLLADRECTAFALRPEVNELAVACETESLVRRYTLNGESCPPLNFTGATAVAYNESGSMVVVGNKYGGVRVYHLNEDRERHGIIQARIRGQRIVRVDFGFHCVIALTDRGMCFRIPFHFVVPPKILVEGQAEQRLIAGDGTPYDWNCYAYAHHPTLSLEAFGGECGVLISQHDVLGLCGVKRTGLGRFIHKLVFCKTTNRLIALGEFGAQIWTVENSVMAEKWQVAGDWGKLGRAAATVKLLEETFEAPRAGLKAIGYAVANDQPTVYWG